MFLKIIYKSELSYLYCYQKRSYTESIGRSFIFVPKRFQDWAKQNRVILDNIIVIGKQLNNQRTGYQKSAAFL